MEQLRGDGLTPPLATYVFARLLAEGRRAELLDLPAQVGLLVLAFAMLFVAFFLALEVAATVPVVGDMHCGGASWAMAPGVLLA